MAIYTQLSLIATPGRVYSFIAKSPAAGKGIGPFTELSVIGSPGAIHSFAAKTSAVGKGIGPFTELSVLSLPGGRHIFLPKSIVVPVPEEPEFIFDAGGGVTGKIREDIYRMRRRDDSEILEIIMSIVLSGRLS